MSITLGLLLVCAAVTLTTAISYYCRYWKKRSPFLNPDEAWLKSDMSRFDFYKAMYNKTLYDPKFLCDRPAHKRQTRIVTNASEAKDFGKIFNRPVSELSPMLTTLFHENQYEKWVYIRKALMKNVFSPKQVELLSLTIQNCAFEILSEVRNSSDPVDVVSLSRKYMNKVLYCCIFNGKAEKDFIKLSSQLRHEESASLKSQGVFKCGNSTRISDAERYFHNLILSHNEDDEDGICFLSVLRRIFSSDPSTVVESNCVAFILGGFTSTVSMLVFALYELTVNEEIQHKLRNELACSMTTGQSFMDQVVKETLRKYPPFAAVIKESDDMTWVLPVSGLHHDPKFYPDPSNFKPSRFSNHSDPRPPFCPFGIGKRRCPGEHFSYKVVKIFLENVLKYFYLQPPPQGIQRELELCTKKFTTSIDRLDVLLVDCNVKVK